MKRVFFETIHSKRIFCSLTNPASKSSKLVIMAHGFRGTSVGPARQFVDFEKLLIESGYTVLRFDQLGSGNSEGSFLDSSFTKWIDCIVHLVNAYAKKGYNISLLGQSMGATASLIAATSTKLDDGISSLLLWVPDPKEDVEVSEQTVYEEAGQKYRGKFWIEAKEANFYHALEAYRGRIHLVYGEKDRYVSAAAREKTIRLCRQKGHRVMLLPGQDHSPWNFNIAQKVYAAELDFLRKTASSKR